MKGDPKFVMLKYSAWLDAAKFEDKILGAVVRYPLKPSNEYLPESPLRYNKTDLVEGCFTNFLHDSTSAKSRNVSAGLESLIGFKWYGSKEESVHLTGKLLRYKRLQQHSQFWSQLKTDEAVIRAVPGWISLLNTWPPCLVVGIMTAEDVELDFTSASEHQRQGELEAPVAAVALAAAGVPSGLLGDSGVGNPQTAVGSGRKVATVFKSSAARSNIFALELRIVTTALFRRRELTLKEDGPKVNPGRLADGGEDFENGYADEIVGVENLVLESFTEEEYEEMD
ncbi:hypothetical protein GQX73_g10439 [Xylaria multiplex]|uniref:Uncharacterized protein n=1 Tax=Xylaria multiplex TaxID=323545 RepID=A0A7C8MQN7_9PEZI|nr:hypothetical protein GQX73_g10439 [Xylaria multiplex]